MAIPTLRTLTRKSKLGFGKYKDLTVQEMLNLRRYKELIAPYFLLTSINYIEDILIELRITVEFRINKPGNNKELHTVFLNSRGFKKRHSDHYGADGLKSEIKALSKSYLQGKNHNR